MWMTFIAEFHCLHCIYIYLYIQIKRIIANYCIQLCEKTKPQLIATWYKEDSVSPQWVSIAGPTHKQIGNDAKRAKVNGHWASTCSTKCACIYTAVLDINICMQYYININLLLALNINVQSVLNINMHLVLNINIYLVLTINFHLVLKINMYLVLSMNIYSVVNINMHIVINIKMH